MKSQLHDIKSLWDMKLQLWENSHTARYKVADDKKQGYNCEILSYTVRNKAAVMRNKVTSQYINLLKNLNSQIMR